ESGELFAVDQELIVELLQHIVLVDEFLGWTVGIDIIDDQPDALRQFQLRSQRIARRFDADAHIGLGLVRIGGRVSEDEGVLGIYNVSSLLIELGSHPLVALIGIEPLDCLTVGIGRSVGRQLAQLLIGRLATGNIQREAANRLLAFLLHVIFLV